MGEGGGALLLGGGGGGVSEGLGGGVGMGREGEGRGVLQSRGRFEVDCLPIFVLGEVLVVVVGGVSGVCRSDLGGCHDDGGGVLRGGFGGAGEGNVAAGGDAVGEFGPAEHGARERKAQLDVVNVGVKTACAVKVDGDVEIEYACPGK